MVLRRRARRRGGGCSFGTTSFVICLLVGKPWDLFGVTIRSVISDMNRLSSHTRLLCCAPWIDLRPGTTSNCSNRCSSSRRRGIVAAPCLGARTPCRRRRRHRRDNEESASWVSETTSSSAAATRPPVPGSSSSSISALPPLHVVHGRATRSTSREPSSAGSLGRVTVTVLNRRSTGRRGSSCCRMRLVRIISLMDAGRRVGVHTKPLQIVQGGRMRTTALTLTSRICDDGRLRLHDAALEEAAHRSATIRRTTC